jgi:uncharacterized protein (TIGR03437 family)
LTNASHPAKLLVTANSGGSITLQFTTYGATGGGGGGGGGGGPTITQVVNNSSSIPPGFPNSGVSPSSLIAIKGSGLADPGDANLHSSQGAGLQTTLNGASITVTSGGMVLHPAMYYATPTQLSAVLPAATPVGAATLTVTYQGVTSAAFNIQVVTAAPGITTFFNGTGVAQDVNRINDSDAGLITFTKSGVPGQGIILWGTGAGADPADSDTTYTVTPHQTSVPYTVYIGGIQASIGYQGATVYPGVSVFGVFIPQNVPTGCYVPVAIVTGNFVSNIATLPIHAGGGVCADPQYGITGDQISTIVGQGTFKAGGVSVIQSTSPGVGGAATTSTSAGATFFQVSGASFAGGGSQVSIGGCVVIQTTQGAGGSTGTTTPLDAGTITVTPPGGGPITLTAIPFVTGFVGATIPAIPATGGSYVFNGAGGAKVGQFTATVNFPNPLLTWTNQSAAATVTRSQGLQVTWSGGAGGTYVSIGGSAVNIGSGASATYVCLAPAAAGQFTVPSYVLLSLPTGTGSTSVSSITNPTLFSANGIDFGTAIGYITTAVTSNYN